MVHSGYHPLLDKVHSGYYSIKHRPLKIMFGRCTVDIILLNIVLLG